jgi:hypothetical protein
MSHPVQSPENLTADTVLMSGTTLPDVVPPPQGKPLPEGLSSIDSLVAQRVEVAPPRVVDPLCPNCRWRLIDPATMGYCPKCGYCRYLEVERHSNANIHLPQPNTNWLGLRGIVNSVAVLPGWLSILLGGSFAVLLYVKAIQQLLPEASGNRPALGLVLLVLGCASMLFSHFWALVKVAPSYAEIGPLDFFSPGLVWGTALRRLPETRWPLWLAAWSLALVSADWWFILR